MLMRASRHRAAYAAVTMAFVLALAGCGGGGGDAAPAASPGAAPPPPARPQSVGTLPSVDVGDPTSALRPNHEHRILTTEPAHLLLTADGFEVGDVVGVTGDGTTAWHIEPAHGVTLLGPVRTSPGTHWRETGPAPGTPARWWALRASRDGTHLMAAGNDGLLHVSADAGHTWAQASPGQRHWSALAMSPEGDWQAAAAYQGGLWLSADAGGTWAEVTPPSPQGPREWISVAISADGRHLVAAEKAGWLEVSQDGGATWVRRGGQPRDWRGVAIAGNGMNMTAVAHDGTLWTSDDIGTTWQLRLEGIPGWYRVEASTDGRTVVAAAAGGHVWVSQDFGVGWEPRFREGPVNALGVSDDGQRIVVAVPWHPSLPDGRVHLSEDGGLTWKPMLHDANWRAVAISGDGRTVLAADNPGSLYTSDGPLAGSEPIAALHGGPGDRVSLVYRGGGVFEVQDFSGNGLWTR